MTLFIALALLLGIWMGLELPWAITTLYGWFEKKRLYKDIYPTPVDESKLCKEPHEWEEVPVTDGTVHSTTNVCSVCGFIPNRNLMATTKGLERIAVNKKLFAFEKKIEQDFIDREQIFLSYFLKQEKLDAEQLMEVYNSGRTSSKRFVIYKLMINEQSTEKVTNDTET